MILKLPKWCLTNKFPAFHDVESLTAIEQTARVYGKINELIDNYNSFAENINKTLEEYAKADQEEEEVFQVAMRQEFQDFINVVDLKIRELEQYVKVNLNVEIRKLWEELNDNGDIQVLINKTLAELVKVVDDIQAEMNEYETNMNNSFEQFKTDTHRTVDEYKQGIDTTVNSFEDRMKSVEYGVSTNQGAITTNEGAIATLNLTQQGINDRLLTAEGSVAGHTEQLGEHTEQLEQLETITSQYAGDISLVKAGGQILYDNSEGIEVSDSLNIAVEGLAKFNLVVIQTTQYRSAVCYLRKPNNTNFYVEGAIPTDSSSLGGLELCGFRLTGTIEGDNGVITKNEAITFLAFGGNPCNISSLQKIRRIIGLI